eukprot:2515793-Pleurochrysis_carterae.AAC.2
MRIFTTTTQHPSLVSSHDSDDDKNLDADVPQNGQATPHSAADDHGQATPHSAAAEDGKATPHAADDENGKATLLPSRTQPSGVTALCQEVLQSQQDRQIEPIRDTCQSST